MPALHLDCSFGLGGDMFLAALADAAPDAEAFLAGLEEVHFHEVGAVDTVVEVAGALPWFTGLRAVLHEPGQEAARRPGPGPGDGP